MIPRLSRLLVISLFLISQLPAQKAQPTPEQMMALRDKLTCQTGTLPLPGSPATVNTGDQFRLLNATDSRILLEQIWGNPGNTNIIGVLVPGNFDALSDDPNMWAAVITYEDSGHVDDDDAAGINYDKLLKEMQEETRESNQERRKLGYEPIELVGWAATPRYDAATHKLYWAKELSFQEAQAHTLNYNIRVLGREGVLVVNVVAGMDALPRVEEQTPAILAALDFNEGQRYADYRMGIDRLAAYGIGGLIAGKVLAKTGLFAALGLFLVKAWKLLVIGVIGIGVYLKKKFAANQHRGT